MKIITLNIRHGGGSRIRPIISRLLRYSADTIVLTEFRENINAGEIKSALKNNGYLWQASCQQDPKVNSVFVASKIEFEVVKLDGIPKGCDGRLIMVNLPDICILSVYFAQKEEKRKLFNYISNSSCINLLEPRGLIIGDFNTGKPFLDEKGETFFCAQDFVNLECIGLIDSWRSRNERGKEFSWYSSAGNGFRIDHIFCTSALNEMIKVIGYDHSPRAAGESDHSAMYVEFQI